MLIFGGDILKFAGMEADRVGKGGAGKLRSLPYYKGRDLGELWPGSGLRYACSSTMALISRVGLMPHSVSLKGDALLALWRVERKQLKNIITVVVKCSLEIHGLFEAKEVEEGLDIRVKIGKYLELGVRL